MSVALHFWATFAHSFDGMVLLDRPKFLCCLPPLNTTMGQISCNLLCVPGYLHLPFSPQNYLRKSFWVMRRSKLFVLLTFKDSMDVGLPLSVLWDKKEDSSKSHEKLHCWVEGGLYLLYMWSGKHLLACGLESLARCPKGGVIILYFLRLSCKTLWSYGATN